MAVPDVLENPTDDACTVDVPSSGYIHLVGVLMLIVLHEYVVCVPRCIAAPLHAAFSQSRHAGGNVPTS